MFTDDPDILHAYSHFGYAQWLVRISVDTAKPMSQQDTMLSTITSPEGVKRQSHIRNPPTKVNSQGTPDVSRFQSNAKEAENTGIRPSPAIHRPQDPKIQTTVPPIDIAICASHPLHVSQTFYPEVMSTSSLRLTRSCCPSLYIWSRARGI